MRCNNFAFVFGALLAISLLGAESEGAVYLVQVAQGCESERVWVETDKLDFQDVSLLRTFVGYLYSGDPIAPSLRIPIPVKESDFKHALENPRLEKIIGREATALGNELTGKRQEYEQHLKDGAPSDPKKRSYWGNEKIKKEKRYLFRREKIFAVMDSAGIHRKHQTACDDD